MEAFVLFLGSKETESESQGVSEVVFKSTVFRLLDQKRVTSAH